MHRTLALLAFLVATAPCAAHATPTTSVMIVGVAHLKAKHDVHNSVFTDSPLSPKRQAQIAAIVERLARFHPTKVLIESTMGDPVWNRRYQQYLAGTFKLGDNEVYQFGYKLASRSGNPAIYPVDTWGPQLIDDKSASGKRIDAYLEANFAKLQDATFDAYVKRSDSIERTGTYLKLLQYLNTDAAIRANASSYAVLAGMGYSSDQAGAAYVAQWYTRNAYIYANIRQVIKPGDRVVVLFGQGHEYLLREFIRLAPDLTYVDPLDYLK
jgi:hypothetical protein